MDATHPPLALGSLMAAVELTRLSPALIAKARGLTAVVQRMRT